MTESWKKLDLFPAYSVSDMGNVRRDVTRTSAVAGRLMRPTQTRDGYLTACLSRLGKKPKTQFVHRLVVHAFIGPIPKDMVVNHKNGVPTDNRLQNLEVVTAQENVLHAWRELKRAPAAPKLNASKARAIRERNDAGEQVTTLAQEYGVSCAMVTSIVTGRSWRGAGGPVRASLMPTRTRLSDEQALELIRRFNAGENRNDLAREFGTNRRTVYNLAQGRTRAYLLGLL